MEYKYDAFISYRHAEKDTKIASEIQQSLERFRIPKALQKQTGKQRFNRVFRDVEELPISSNLTEDLTEALRSSEYLIVICSYRTSESDWVKREIDTFLELHDYNKQLVLTVLVEGEPDEVIPEVLRHDNIIHYLADGTFYCKDEMVEPLAADYRMPISKARKIELPRLAASMLGCNYDDIIRRRKAFKRRRLLIETIVISIAAIALMTYIGWMLMKIQTNLRNAQMNQSRYLSTEAVRLLEDGDRISALQLAIAALENTDGTRRPVTSEAEYALSAALGAYQTYGSSLAAPVWRYEVSSAIVKYASNNTADHVAILDTSGKLHVWDRKDHKETLFGDDSNIILDFEYDKNDDLIIVYSGYAGLYDSGSMEEKWRFNNTQMVSRRDVMIQYYPEKEYVALNASDALYILNAVNGNVVIKIETDELQAFKDKRAKTGYFFSMFRFLINADFSQIALVGMDGANSYSMYVYDVKNSTCTQVIDDSGVFLDAAFDKDGNIMVLRYSLEDTKALKNVKTNEYYDAAVIMELISSNGKSLWKNEVSSTIRVEFSKLASFEYTLKDKSKTPVVIAAFGNRLVVADKKTGKIFKNHDFAGSVVSCGSIQSGNDIYINAVIRNGTAYWLPLNELIKKSFSRKFFPDGTLKMKSFKSDDGISSYLVEDASERVITEFGGRFFDTTFKGFDGSEKMTLIDAVSKTKDADYLIAVCDNNKMSGIDVKNKKILWTKDLPVYNGLHYYDVYTSDNKYTFMLKEVAEGKPTFTCGLIRINCLTGDVEDMNNDFSFYGLVAHEGSDNKIFAVSDEEKEMEGFNLFSYDVSTDQVKKIKMNIKELGASSYSNIMGVSPDGKKVLVYIETKSGKITKNVRLIIDSETGKYTTSDCGSVSKVVWNDLGTLFAEVNDEGNITVSSTDGKERYKIDTEMRIPKGMAFYENRLYVVYNLDVLCSYDSIGKQIMSIQLGHGDLGEDDMVKFEFVRQNLFVTAGDYTDIINILDKKSIGSFSGFLCLYNKKEAEKDITQLKLISKSFTTGEDVNRIGWFEYKSVAKMIDQAKEYLKQNGVTMSEDFRKKYGIE